MGTVDINYGLITWSQASEPTGSDVKPFLVWYDTTNDLWKIRNTQNTGWWTMALISGGGSAAGDTGIFTSSAKGGNTIEYFTISSTGNATDFGDRNWGGGDINATSNGTSDRGLLQGYTVSNTDSYNYIDYITISSPGNATDFGDLTQGRYCDSCSNGTNDRGVWGPGGRNTTGSHPEYNIIDYVTISTTGNATDFGDATGTHRLYSSTSNGTNERGIFGGNRDTPGNLIEYITISTTGNSIDFGDLTVARYRSGATSNGTSDRGIFDGGDTGGGYVNTIDYVTISSTGDATDFGDLTVARYYGGATSNGTNDRGVFGGGYTGSYVNTIEYVTISSTGNATDFGDLATEMGAAGTSNGLQ